MTQAEPKHYAVEKRAGDAARPYIVVKTFTRHNRVVAHYEDEASAERRCRDLNRASAHWDECYRDDENIYGLASMRQSIEEDRRS